MSNPVSARLPAGMTLAAYMAAGFCLFVSFQQMTQIFSQQGVEVGGAPLLPAAILTGGAVCWRLLGHMVARQSSVRTFTAALCFVAGGALYVEAMSISTSTLALSVGLQERIQRDIEATPEHETAAATQAAAGRAVAELASRLESLPANYHTRAGHTAEQITVIMDKQQALAQLQRDQGLSATAQAFEQAGERFGLTGADTAFRWALGIALAISLIPLAVQLALGSLSDAVITERSTEPPRGRTSDTEKTLPEQSTEARPGNVRSLSRW